MRKKKKNSVRHGNQTHGPLRYRLGALTTELRETLGELGHLLGSYVTRVLHTARISNVESVCSIDNVDGKF